MFLFKKFFGIGSLRTGARFTALIDVILGCFFIYLGVMCIHVFEHRSKGHLMFVSILCFINGLLSISLSILLIVSIYKECLRNLYIWVILKIFVLLSFPIVSFILIDKQINENFSIGIIIATIILFILLNVFVIYLWVCMFFYYHELRTELLFAEQRKFEQEKNCENNELTLVYINDKCDKEQKRVSDNSYSSSKSKQQELDVDCKTVKVYKTVETVDVDFH